MAELTPFDVRDRDVTHVIIELFGGDNNLNNFVTEDLQEMASGNRGSFSVLALADYARRGGVVIELSPRAGNRVVISTGTKTLQEQLFNKDVPFLEREAGVGKLRVCYMKGRNNYLCRQKLYDVADKPVLTGLEQIDHFRIIQEWEKSTVNGDRAELAALPEASTLWPRLDARADACTGQKCKQFDRCFITEMRRRAAESGVVGPRPRLSCSFSRLLRKPMTWLLRVIWNVPFNVYGFVSFERSMRSEPSVYLY